MWKFTISKYYIGCCRYKTNIIYHIISNFIPISYIKTDRHKKWCWGHDRKAIKAWENHALNKGFNKNIQKLAKNTLYKTNKIHKNIQDMLQNELNCIQIVKLISADFWRFGCFAKFYTLVHQKIPTRRSTISNCTIRKYFLCFINPRLTKPFFVTRLTNGGCYNPLPKFSKPNPLWNWFWHQYVGMDLLYPYIPKWVQSVKALRSYDVIKTCWTWKLS